MSGRFDRIDRPERAGSSTNIAGRCQTNADEPIRVAPMAAALVLE